MTRTLQSLLVIATLSGADALTHPQNARGGWTVRLRFPDGVDTTKLQVTYQLTTLAGGGYQTVAHMAPGGREYVVDASVGEHKHPALSFQAIVYCPGYRLVLVTEAPPADESRTKTVAIDFQPLERIPLVGRWVSPPRNLADFDLEVAYLAPWSHQFFGIWDGAIASLDVGSARFGRDGAFALQVPDFSRDLVVASYAMRGELRLRARERKTGNISFSLEDAHTPARPVSLPIDKPLPAELLLVGVVR
jgi:hypothetical protein